MVRYNHHRNVWLTSALILLATAPAALSQSAGLPQPLTDRPGNAARGKAVAINSDMGNCLICHHISAPEVPSDAAGDLGPSLDGIGSRMGEAQLRQRIVDPRVILPDTIMPAYHATDGLTRVDPFYAGKPILSDQDVEDLVAYLLTLK